MTRPCEPHCMLSEDGQRSYGFEAVWNCDLPIIGFVMLHPHFGYWYKDRELAMAMSFAQDHRYGGARVAYLYPERLFSEQSCSSLTTRVAPDTSRSDGAILDLFDICRPVVAAWGDALRESERAEHIVQTICSLGLAGNLFHLGLTREGIPKAITQVSRKARATRWKV